MTGVDTNADQLAGSLRGAAGQLVAGLGTENQMAAVLAGQVTMPRRTGAAAGTVRATGTPSTVTLTAGGGPADYVNILEFGSRWVPAKHPLKRALDAATPQLLDLAAEGVQDTLDRI